MANVTTKALWAWTGTGGPFPTCTGFYGSSPTKSGVLAQDVRDFAGVPLGYRSGTTTTLMADSDIQAVIRAVEDGFEQTTSILLTPTQVASPPARTALEAFSAAITPVGGTGPMLLGVDYDLADAAYDFKYDRAIDNAWLIQSLRYRPLRIANGDPTAIKQMAYVYPLLNQFFQIPPSWWVEDLDSALVRVVPAENVQALPLFALQLAVQGFAQSVPGGIWLQYTAGLTPVDYSTRFGFISTMIKCGAAAVCLGMVQGTVNQGLDSTSVLTDGVQTTFKYRNGGAYADLIQRFQEQYERFQEQAMRMTAPVVEFL